LDRCNLLLAHLLAKSEAQEAQEEEVEAQEEVLAVAVVPVSEHLAEVAALVVEHLMVAEVAGLVSVHQ
jgi:hypothetical protein